MPLPFFFLKSFEHIILPASDNVFMINKSDIDVYSMSEHNI